MSRELIFRHEFVEYIPSELKDGTIYVSIAYATASHKCFCGCGNEVVTPISPTDWELTFDGKTISLNPSIGNWSFPCQSHYWLKRNRIRWAPRMSKKEIAGVRAQDRIVKEKYFAKIETSTVTDTETGTARAEEPKKRESIWSKVKGWLS